jgi:hypothetical protein
MVAGLFFLKGTQPFFKHLASPNVGTLFEHLASPNVGTLLSIWLRRMLAHF